MRKRLLTLLVLAAVLLFSATLVSADSDNSALVVRLDGNECEWFFGSLAAEGGLQYVETQNGKWTLSCHGDIVAGLPIDQAVTVMSTADDPAGVCFTPFGSTYDWQMTFSPDGTSSFTCQGDLTPTEPGENGALIISLEDECRWSFGDFFARGDLHYTESPNGTWTLVCQGDILSGLPDTTVRFNSTPDDPVGVCRTPFDTTLDWQAIYSPSGKSSFVCQGELPY